jgi:ribosomal protein S18 acetylase RimI-like enzyme
MGHVRIVDVVDAASFDLVPPCADPRYDHRSCDYWEDADRGSKAPRRARSTGTPPSRPAARPASPNPFAPGPASRPIRNPFLADLEEQTAVDNPFLPRAAPAPSAVLADAPGKLALLSRGLAVFGTYAKVLLVDDAPSGYTQFGPLSAYPRALRLRDLYPQLPQAPLPAVITCIATTRDARRLGLAAELIAAVCRDLAERGFSAVEAYPEVNVDEDSTSSATPRFWAAVGFHLAIADERFPVFRRELD